MNGYENAKRCDDIINMMLTKEPIVASNAREWLTFARTVKSSMEIVEQTAKDIISSETRIIIEKRKNE